MNWNKLIETFDAEPLFDTVYRRDERGSGETGTILQSLTLCGAIQIVNIGHTYTLTATRIHGLSGKEQTINKIFFTEDQICNAIY